MRSLQLCHIQDLNSRLSPRNRERENLVVGRGMASKKGAFFVLFTFQVSVTESKIFAGHIWAQVISNSALNVRLFWLHSRNGFILLLVFFVKVPFSPPWLIQLMKQNGRLNLVPHYQSCLHSPWKAFWWILIQALVHSSTVVHKGLWFPRN